MTWMVVLSWLRKVPTWAWAALGIVVCLMVLRAHWIGVGAESVRRDWDKQKAADLIVVQQAAEDARNKEAAQKKSFAATAETLRKENTDARQKIDRLTADLRDGRLRVREALRCPRAVPGTAASAPGNIDDGGAYISRTDQEFFLRIGAEADRAARQLTACQAILQAERN